jgi:hypothetical protein
MCVIVDVANAAPKEKAEARRIVREKFLAVLMLNGANGSKYNGLKRSMNENYVTGTSTYPESPEVVLHILHAYQPPPEWNRRKQEGVGEEGAMFVQVGDDSWKANITCHECRKKGHLA